MLWSIKKDFELNSNINSTNKLTFAFMPLCTQSPSYVWTEDFQVELLSEHFKAFDRLRKKNFFIGEMIWNFADFNTAESE